MSPWAYAENIAWALAFCACVILLDGAWKLLCIVPVLLVNYPRSKP
jgi:hypothetical protein